MEYVKFEILGGYPDGDEGYMSWESKSESRTRNMDLRVIRVILEAMDVVETTQGETCRENIRGSRTTFKGQAKEKNSWKETGGVSSQEKRKE